MKVICVDPNQRLTLNKTYEITETNSTCGTVFWECVNDEGVKECFYPHRFKKIDEQQAIPKRLMECVDYGGNTHISNGKVYEVVKEDSEYYYIIADNGDVLQYFKRRFKPVNQEQNTNMNQEKVYQELQKQWVNLVDLKEGDSVKVLCKASSYMGGWGLMWTAKMDSAIGNVLTVVSVNPKDGIRLQSNDKFLDAWFPYSILEKVPYTPKEVKINGTYTAKINKDGSITVGCTTVPYDVAKRIWEEVQKVKS